MEVCAVYKQMMQRLQWHRITGRRLIFDIFHKKLSGDQIHSSTKDPPALLINGSLKVQPGWFAQIMAKREIAHCCRYYISLSLGDHLVGRLTRQRDCHTHSLQDSSVLKKLRWSVSTTWTPRSDSTTIIIQPPCFPILLQSPRVTAVL